MNWNCSSQNGLWTVSFVSEEYQRIQDIPNKQTKKSNKKKSRSVGREQTLWRQAMCLYQLGQIPPSQGPIGWQGFPRYHWRHRRHGYDNCRGNSHVHDAPAHHLRIWMDQGGKTRRNCTSACLRFSFCGPKHLKDRPDHYSYGSPIKDEHALSPMQCRRSSVLLKFRVFILVGCFIAAPSQTH